MCEFLRCFNETDCQSATVTLLTHADFSFAIKSKFGTILYLTVFKLKIVFTKTRKNYFTANLLKSLIRFFLVSVLKNFLGWIKVNKIFQL